MTGCRLCDLRVLKACACHRSPFLMGFVMSKHAHGAVVASRAVCEASTSGTVSCVISQGPRTLPSIIVTAPSREDLLTPNPVRTIEGATKERRPGVPVYINRQPFTKS